MWDFMAITTYVIASTMYLFMPLIPDLAMARDRSTGWRKSLYRYLSLGFRGTEPEWKHLKTAMNIFAFAIIPVMFSVHTVVSWDFAMSTRPGWNSTIFGPYFVIGALHSGIAAVMIVIFMIRSTMKNMKYFIRPEHFEFLGKLSLIVSMTWAYFFFNDYLVPWYGGNKFEKLLLDFHSNGPFAYVWVTMLICNIVIPWLILWNKKWRSTPWVMLLVGIVINVGMWIERFIIIPVSLNITRMPFTWRVYKPSIEIPLTIGTFALFMLLYMLASRLIPLVPVWEVQEGQSAHILRKVGKAVIPTVSNVD
jgi:molybdopterin-containing oxidoreductase family membrane subunit